LAIAKDWQNADVTDLETASAHATAAGHRIVVQQVVGDTEGAIRETLARWMSDKSIDAIVVLGGGESDAVSAAMKPLISAPLPGFTDLFRWLMFQEQGASAMLSSAEAARCGETFVFVLPGAVRAAMDKLILPQFDPDASGKNLLKQLPRLRTDVDADAAIPTEIAPEKTQGGSGMPARLPASSATRAPAHSTGKHVVIRGSVPKDPDTAPIDLHALERNLAASTTDAPTKQTDLQKMLPKLPPGAQPEPDETKVDTIAAPPAPTPSRTQSKGVDLAAKLAAAPNIPVRTTPVPAKLEPAVRSTPVPVTINPRKRNEPGSKPPVDAKAATPSPDAPKTPNPDVAARARRASASLPKSGAPTTIRTKPPTEPPKGMQRGAGVFATQMSASPPMPKQTPAMIDAKTTIDPKPAMIDAATTISPPKGMIGAQTVVSKRPETSGIMPLELDDEAVETIEPDENTGRFKKDRVDTDVDEQETKRADRLSASVLDEAPTTKKSEPEAKTEPKTRPPTKPPPAKVTLEKSKVTSQEAFAQTQVATTRAVPDDLPKERRNSGGLPRSTFTYPSAKKGMHPAIKVLGLLAIVGLGFGAVVFAFRDKKPAEVTQAGSGSTEPVVAVTIDASVPVLAIDASVVAIETDAAVVEPAADAAVVEAPVDAATQVAIAPPKGKPTGTKPTTKPGETKPGETKPNETGETKPVEAVTPPEDDCDETSCVAGNYDKPCCTKYKPKGPEIAVRTDSGLPKQLDRSAVRAGIDGVRARITTCGEKAATKGTVKVHVTVSADGVVTESSVEESPDSTLGACVAAAMKSAKFSKSEDGGSFSYPFVF
jgi:molybdenum cofactor biosynthesis protein B